MTSRIAINGYGRIGRCFLRALLESDLQEELAVVHINEPANLDSMVYLTRFDSTHGRFSRRVEKQSDGLLIDGAKISVSHTTKPHEVDWRTHHVDLLVEYSGQYDHRKDLDMNLALAEMYVQGVSTRKVIEVLQKLVGPEVSISSTQISRCAQ